MKGPQLELLKVMHPMDYRALLVKYMEHVRECEGISFVGRLDSDVTFTPEEIEELESIEQGIDKP
jgi:hypothetical protein